MADETQAEDITETAAVTDTTTDETMLADADVTNSEDGKDVDSPANDTDSSEDETAEDEDAAKSEDTDEDDEDDSDDKAEPTTYDDLEIPEGMEVDEAALGDFKELAAKMNDGKGLSQEDAQTLVSFRAEMVKAGVAQWETTFSEWRGELHSDKDIGGDKLQTTTIPNVLAAAEKYGDAEMISLLKTNKMYGENPSLIRLLNRVGATLSEDSHVKAGRNAKNGKSKDASEIMYPDKSPK